MKEIFTIGDSNYNIEYFLQLLIKNNIDCIVDVRSDPHDNCPTEFNMENLNKTLDEYNIVYNYMGYEFGITKTEENSYYEEENSEFEKVEKNFNFLQGIERLKIGISMGYNIALMYSENDNFKYDYCITIGKILEKADFNVNHIMKNGACIHQQHIEERFLQEIKETNIYNNCNKFNLLEESYLRNIDFSAK